MLSPTETVQRAYYDGVAARWDLDAYYWMYKEKRERQILLAVEILRAQFPDRSWHRIAQWGGGDALQCEAFARAGCRCVSFDISRAMLRVGQRLAAQHDYGSSLQWVQGTAEGTAPFRDAAFDVNMALSCLNHIHPDRWEVYLRERVRVTAPGGLVFDVVPNLENRAQAMKAAAFMACANPDMSRSGFDSSRVTMSARSMHRGSIPLWPSAMIGSATNRDL